MGIPRVLVFQMGRPYVSHQCSLLVWFNNMHKSYDHMGTLNFGMLYNLLSFLQMKITSYYSMKGTMRGHIRIIRRMFNMGEGVNIIAKIDFPG